MRLEPPVPDVSQRVTSVLEQGPAPRVPAPMVLPPLPEHPLVSVLVSNYNYAAFLPDALNSLLAQTYRRSEIIVCDDGSTDESAAVIRAFAARDERVRGVFQRNGGQAAAWSRGFAQSRGDIVCFLDSDDVCHPAKLQTVVRAFQEHPRAGLLNHQLVKVVELGNPLGPPFPQPVPSGWLAADALACRGWGNWGAFCLRRAVAERLFPLPVSQGFGDGYIQTAGRLLTEVIGVPLALAEYRIHGGNDSGAERPDRAAIETVLRGFEAIFRAFREFVLAEFDPAVAEGVRLENFRAYWEHLLVLYILLGKQGDEVRGVPVRTVVENIPLSSRKLIWRLLLALPPGPSRRALDVWWGTTPWKRVTRPVTRVLGLN